MEVRIIRSTERKRTISARVVNNVIQLYLPIGLSSEEESKFIQWAEKRFKAHQRKRELFGMNAYKELEKKAERFNKEYFGGELSWQWISYSTEQNRNMFGNCNYKNKTIRISDRLLKMPPFVHDYVLIHELAHLKVPGHGPEFWELVSQYPKAERAKGYLMAMGMGD